jgi:2-dehydro-3-deoxygluconokinase
MVGADPFGRLVLDYLAEAGVGVDYAGADDMAPTGVYFKQTGLLGTEVVYYRANSAASRMTPSFADALRPLSPAILHLSGITPALSASCLDLMRSLIEDRPIDAGCISFDVNFRRALWSSEEAAPELLRLAMASDVVFVGLDEAEELWNVSSPEAVRDLIPGPRVLVIKDDASSAISFQKEVTAAAAPEVISVIDAVGAGDAFAAGWLSGLLRGRSPRERLELGHSVAARVLRTVFDDVELPAAMGAGNETVDALDYS